MCSYYDAISNKEWALGMAIQSTNNAQASEGKEPSETLSTQLLMGDLATCTPDHMFPDNMHLTQVLITRSPNY